MQACFLGVRNASFRTILRALFSNVNYNASSKCLTMNLFSGLTSIATSPFVTFYTYHSRSRISHVFYMFYMVLAYVLTVFSKIYMLHNIFFPTIFICTTKTKKPSISSFVALPLRKYSASKEIYAMF